MALCVNSRVVCYQKNNTVRINIVERYNPLKYLPALRNPKLKLKLPYYNFDYNKIEE